MATAALYLSGGCEPRPDGSVALHPFLGLVQPKFVIVGENDAPMSLAFEHESRLRNQRTGVREGANGWRKTIADSQLQGDAT
jgi:hypothetical protein